MKTPEKEFYIKLTNNYHTALRELQQFIENKPLRSACGFQTLEEATSARARKGNLRTWNKGIPSLASDEQAQQAQQGARKSQCDF